MDQRVEIHSTSRADINGKRGVATDFHPMDRADRTTWRYTVQLDSGEAFKVKRSNVRALDKTTQATKKKAKEDGGAGKGKKGKGKKGRGGRK